MKKTALLLLLSSSLSAMDINSVSAAFDGSPDANIAGCVNAKTGDLFTSAADIYVPGYEPISISRIYLSSGHVDAHNIWTVLPHRLLYEENGTFYAAEPEGGVVPLNRKEGQLLGVDLKKIPLSVTNTSQGKIAPDTSIKLYSGFEHAKDYVEIDAPNGTRRYYLGVQLFTEAEIKKNIIKTKSIFFLVREVLPNGNQVLYEYPPETFSGEYSAVDRFCFPKKIRTTNPSESITYASIEFNWDEHNLHFTTSDGKAGTFEAFVRGNSEQKHSHKCECFFNFTGTRGELEWNNYKPNTPQKLFLLQNKRLYGKRGIDAEYYEPSAVRRSPFGGSILTQKNDPRNFRVSTLFLPTGKDGEMEAAYFFNYHIPESSVICDARTDVTAADKSYTSFFFAPNTGLLASKQIYSKKNYLLQKTEYHWDTGYESRGNLLSESRYGSGKKVLEIQRKYGKKRMSPYIESVTAVGDLTGDRSNSTFTTSFIHETNSFHQLREKWDDNGGKEVYEYLPGTDLPARIETFQNDILIKVQFCTYDKNNWLIIHSIFDPILDEVITLEYDRFQEGATPGFPKEERQLYNGKTIAKTTFAYNDHCQVTEKTVYGASALPLYTLTYEYDCCGNCIKETDSIGRVTTRKFNEFRELIYEKKGSEPFATLYTYDAMGNCTLAKRQNIDGETKAIYKIYDKRSYLIEESDELGNTSQYLNDPLGRPLIASLPGSRKYHYIYDYFSSPVIAVDPLGRSAHTSYTALGNPSFQEGFDGIHTETRYHGDGRIESKKVKKLIHKYHYDLYQNNTSITHHDLQGTLVSTEHSQKYSLFHLLEETTKTGALITYIYGDRGLIDTKVDGNFSIYYKYDALGNVIEELHTLHGKTKLRILSEHDLAGRIISEKKFDDEDVCISSKKLLYDNYDNILFSDESGATRHFTYDGWNRPVEEKDPEGNTTRYAYEDGVLYQGLLCSQKKTFSPRGTQTITLTGPTGKLLKSTTIDSFGITLITTTYTYNKNDDLIEEVHSGSTTRTIQKTYDVRGNLSTLTEIHGNSAKTTNYSYNNFNEYIKCEKPSGLTLFYAHDAEGRVCKLSSSDGTIDEERSYDLYGNLIFMRSHEIAIERRYDKHGNLIEETLPIGRVTSSYNDMGQKTKLTTPKGTVSYTYKGDRSRSISFGEYTHTILAYDTHGNITEEKDIYDSHRTYTYDLLSRKTKSVTPFLEETAQYDSESNLIHYSLNEDTHTLTYDELSQLIQDNNDTYASDAHYRLLSKNSDPLEYDNHGHLTSYKQTSYESDIDGRRLQGKHRYAYDALDRLISIQTEETHVTFTYDTLHRVLSKTTNGKTQHYLYDNLRDIGSTSDYRILGPHGTIALFQGKTHAVYTDLLGNIRALISETSELYPYSLYGENYPENSSPYRYHAKRQTLSIYNFGARAYDPETMQWLSEDPAGYIDAPYLHQFLKNNPFKYKDDLGFSVETLKSSANFSKSLMRNSTRLAGFEMLMDAGSYLSYETGMYSSSRFECGGNDSKLPPIVYINGIRTSLDEAKSTAEYISKMANGHKVIGIHNASHTWALDVPECLLGRMGLMSPPTRMLASTLQELRSEYGSKSKILLTAHSGGGICTKNALLSLTESARKQALVLAFAPGAIIPDDLCCKSYNYASKRDFVTVTDVVGLAKYGNQLNILTPHPEAPMFDHSIESPTFAQKLKQHLSDYIEKGTIQ